MNELAVGKVYAVNLSPVDNAQSGNAIRITSIDGEKTFRYDTIYRSNTATHAPTNAIAEIGSTFHDSLFEPPSFEPGQRYKIEGNIKIQIAEVNQPGHQNEVTYLRLNAKGQPQSYVYRYLSIYAEVFKNAKLIKPKQVPTLADHSEELFGGD